MVLNKFVKKDALIQMICYLLSFLVEIIYQIQKLH